MNKDTGISCMTSSGDKSPDQSCWEIRSLVGPSRLSGVIAPFGRKGACLGAGRDRARVQSEPQLLLVLSLDVHAPPLVPASRQDGVPSPRALRGCVDPRPVGFRGRKAQHCRACTATFLFLLLAPRGQGTGWSCWALP